jgi:nucleotide-binding universal stress UspA family protein
MSTTSSPSLALQVPERAAALVPSLAHARVSWPARLVLATDGSPSADAAFRTARAFSLRTGATVEIVAVYTPRIPLPALPGSRAIERCAPSDRRELADLLRAVRRQMSRALAEPRHLREWPLTLTIGDPGLAIDRAAAASSADLTIVGIGADEPLDREAGTRTAITAARYTINPLYSAAHGCEAPTHAIIPMIDGRLHPATVRAAVACLLPGGRISIAATELVGTSASQTGENGTARELVMRVCGKSWSARIDTLDIQRIVVGVDGDAARATLRLAAETHAQLIAVPIFGDPGPVRAFLPNWADTLLLGARCSVLVVPDGTGPEPGAGIG